MSDSPIAILRALKEGSLPAHERPTSLAGATLAGEDLSGLDLSGLDLECADLQGCDLQGANLFRARLTGANLGRANLTGAEMTGADLAGAHLEGVRAPGAGLGKANLTGALLFEADLSRATLSMANLEGADLRCCNLAGGRLRHARLASTDFTGADLQEADLSLCDVSGASFNNADLRDARLRSLRGFERANWIGVDVRNINFAGAYRVRRFVVDQNYLKEFRESGLTARVLYYIWLVTSNCGRSMSRWCLLILLQVVLFAWLFTQVEMDFGRYQTAISPLYVAVVTLTSLGYGDVVPASVGGQIVSMLAVVTGYVMLGGLISIFSNLIARRAD